MATIRVTFDRKTCKKIGEEVIASSFKPDINSFLEYLTKDFLRWEKERNADNDESKAEIGDQVRVNHT